jgi:predicted nucleic acid-binding protein
MGALIDSSVLIAAERGKLDLEARVADYGDEPIAIAAVTASELLHGIHRATTVALRARREAYVEGILAELAVVPFDLVVARIHARLWADLAAKGTNVGAHDLQIAATALAVGYDVATHDLRSFPKIPGIKTLHW